MHEHHHETAPQTINKAFKIGIFINLAFVLIEGSTGWFSNSLSLIADAGHNLSDVLGLVVSWVALRLSSRGRDRHRTYGYKRSSILAALFNAVFLLLAVGGIIVEAVQRLGDPQPVMENQVMIVAGIGIVINGATALLFMKDQQRDLNVKGAFLHMAADALVSVGVVLAAMVIKFTNWFWLDPVISLVIAVVIFAGTWGLLKDAMDLSLDAVPKMIDVTAVESLIRSQDNVVEIHDLHIWALSTTENALTVHVSRDTLMDNNQFLQELDKQLTTKFPIDHVTIQVELGRIEDESVDHVI